MDISKVARIAVTVIGLSALIAACGALETESDPGVNLTSGSAAGGKTGLVGLAPRTGLSCTVGTRFRASYELKFEVDTSPKIDLASLKEAVEDQWEVLGEANGSESYGGCAQLNQVWDGAVPCLEFDEGGDGASAPVTVRVQLRGDRTLEKITIKGHTEPPRPYPYDVDPCTVWVAAQAAFVANELAALIHESDVYMRLPESDGSGRGFAKPDSYSGQVRSGDLDAFGRDTEEF